MTIPTNTSRRLAAKLVRLAKILIHGQVLQGPGTSYPPGGINPAALPLWRDIITRYHMVIYTKPENVDQWDAAISIFERACKSRKIAPWS